MTLETIDRTVISQYQGRPEKKFITETLKTMDRGISNPVAQITRDVEVARGPVLDAIGDTLGFSRPAVRDDSVRVFGWADEDTSFGEGPFAEELPHVGPTTPLEDDHYRRLLKARANVLISRATLPDVVRSANHLFTDQWVYANGSNSVSWTPRIYGMTEVSNKIYAIGGSSPNWTRWTIDPRTQEVTMISGSLTTPGNAPPVGLSHNFITGQFLVTVSDRGIYPVDDWDSDSPTLGTPLLTVGPSNPNGLRISTGIGRWRERYFVMANSTQDPFPMILHELDLINGTLTQVSSQDGHTWGVANTPTDMLIGQDVGISRLVDLPSNPADSATWERVITRQGQNEAMAYYGGKLIWYHLQGRSLEFRSLEDPPGFTVYGEDEDVSYLDVVTQNAESVLSRPAGIPMKLVTRRAI